MTLNSTQAQYMVQFEGLYITVNVAIVSRRHYQVKRFLVFPNMQLHVNVEQVSSWIWILIGKLCVCKTWSMNTALLTVHIVSLGLLLGWLAKWTLLMALCFQTIDFFRSVWLCRIVTYSSVHAVLDGESAGLFLRHLHFVNEDLNNKIFVAVKITQHPAPLPPSAPTTAAGAEQMFWQG